MALQPLAEWPAEGAINRVALSANELLLPRLASPRRARELKIDEEDWRCFRLIDREVYLGWPLPIAISHQARVVESFFFFGFDKRCALQ